MGPVASREGPRALLFGGKSCRSWATRPSRGLGGVLAGRGGASLVLGVMVRRRSCPPLGSLWVVMGKVDLGGAVLWGTGTQGPA